jgi:hypothetical protein
VEPIIIGLYNIGVAERMHAGGEEDRISVVRRESWRRITADYIYQRSEIRFFTKLTKEHYAKAS